MKIEKYNIANRNEWDDFVGKSKNATFLFYRNYMEYHSERYIEHSLMIYEGNDLIALLPANLSGNTLVSHGYLTYGGFLVDEKMKTMMMLNIFDELKKYCAQTNIERIIYKAIPYIYHSRPSGEDLYSLFRNDAILSRREVSSCLYIQAFKAPLNRKNGFNKAVKNNLVLKETDDFTNFVDIMNGTLREKYGTNAVHTAEELELLHNRFPENIKLYGAFRNDELLGGAVIFQNRAVAHAQYLHTSGEGKKFRCLDFILITLLNEYYNNYTYFDFGYSTEDGGKYLNESLINLKEEFGASAVCYDTYQMEL